jgi:hypothetical protein
MPSEDALVLLAIHCKPDPWYDTRAKIGGGDAIDLAMHVLRLSFVDAVRTLIERDHPHG